MDGGRVPALGPRGEGWVALQLVALSAVGATGLAGPRPPAPARLWAIAAGLVLAVAGGWLGVAGVRGLGSSLTAFPRPLENAELREHGPYALVRHPLYGALILLALAWSALTSPWALVPAVCLAFVLLAKSIREERWLIDRYPEYAGYRERVRRRFLPFVW